MIGEKINTELARAIKNLLKQSDYKVLSKKVGVSVSTINNLLDGRQAVTKRNKEVVSALHDKACERIVELQEIVKNQPF